MGVDWGRGREEKTKLKVRDKTKSCTNPSLSDLGLGISCGGKIFRAAGKVPSFGKQKKKRENTEMGVGRAGVRL